MPPLIVLQPYIQAQQTYLSQHSLRFNSNDLSYMSRAFAPSGTTATFSFWIKRSALGTTQSPFGWSNGSTVSFNILFNTSDQLDLASYSSAYNARKLTNRVFRDVSSWYHIVCVVDTTNATAADRMRVYVNGVRETSFSASVDPSQNLSTALSSNVTWGIGGTTGVNINYINGYLSEFNFIDGQALTPSNFGVTDFATGQWKPITYTGTYGTSGFYLPFNDGTSTTTLGYDRSGNANNWTLTNFSIVPGVNNDWYQDTPTNNFCTLNPLQQGTYAPTISNGGLNASGTYGQANATMAVSTGKWYFEYVATSIGAQLAGVGIEAGPVTSPNIQSSVAYSYTNNGNKFVRASNTTYGATWTTNDIIGVAFDLDNHTIEFFKNGVSQGVAASDITTGLYYSPTTGAGGTAGTNVFYINFGQRAFVYTPPTGFKPLCTSNLSTPTIVQGNIHFDVKTYVGNGTSNSVTGLNFQPDLVWGKSRSFVQSNGLYDSVRGVQKALYSDLNYAETTDVNALTSFNTDGFSLGSSASLNQNSSTYVTWNWKAGGAAVTNTDGAITSQVSANTTAGFSIVTFTGNGATSTSVGHGLGAAPKLYMIAPRSTTGGFAMVHTLVDGTVDYMFLNSPNANGNATQTVPTSTTFNVRADAAENATGRLNVVYCFAEVAGFSKFGKYTGNGNANGPFIYCGFKPKYLLVKRADASAHWYVTDGGRDTINEVQTFLYPSLSNAESIGTAGSYREDFLSNGFKVRGTGADINASGGTYIFMAFAESPFVYSNAR